MPEMSRSGLEFTRTGAEEEVVAVVDVASRTGEEDVVDEAGFVVVAVGTDCLGVAVVVEAGCPAAVVDVCVVGFVVVVAVAAVAGFCAAGGGSSAGGGIGCGSGRDAPERNAQR